MITNWIKRLFGKTPEPTPVAAPVVAAPAPTPLPVVPMVVTNRAVVRRVDTLEGHVLRAQYQRPARTAPYARPSAPPAPPVSSSYERRTVEDHRQDDSTMSTLLTLGVLAAVLHDDTPSPSPAPSYTCEAPAPYESPAPSPSYDYSSDSGSSSSSDSSSCSSSD